MNLELKERQCVHLTEYLINNNKFDLIDLLAKSDKLKIHTLKVNKRLVPNRVYHNAIISYLKRNGVDIIYPNGEI